MFQTTNQLFIEYLPFNVKSGCNMNFHLWAGLIPKPPNFNTRIMCFLSTLGPPKRHLDARRHEVFQKWKQAR